MQDIIRIKRDGGELPDEAIREFIAGVSTGFVPDYQAAALLMAIFLRGFSPRELATWADSMTHSGEVVDLSGVRGRKVDKHSTGGVGDKVSLCLAPLVAACGVPVPMISGRGLGHTGGTLDKLEAIPGFNTRLSVPRFIEVLEACGLALIGQTEQLAPADRKLYALRDVTSTVESIPLIASSIMSKKIAEGIDALVLDVKVGSGAFMKELDSARALARTIMAIGAAAGKGVTVLITDMNQPLGREVGNANETREAIEILQGAGPADLWEITRALAVEMLLAGAATSDPEEAGARVDRARSDGSGLARLRHCVALQGGDPRTIDNPALLPQAAGRREVCASRAGFLGAIDTEQVGIAGMALGAGRRRVEDNVNHGVGITFLARLGDELAAGQPIAQLCHEDEHQADEAAAMLSAACTIVDEPLAAPPLIYEVLK